MAQNESVERYLSEQYPEKYYSTDPDDKAYISRLRKRINESIGYFESKGITSPHEENYLELNAWVSLKEGKPKGKPISKKTVADWVSCTRSYYDWKEGEKQMLFKNEDISAQQAEIEPEGAEALQQGEIEPVSSECVSSECVAAQEISIPAESERVSEAEGADHGASVEEVATGRKDSGSLSVDTPQAEYITDTEQKPKRGRKPKAAAEKRTVKLSIYLTPSLYSALDDLAHYDQREISDVIYGLVEDFTERNAEQLLDYRSFLARRKAIR